MTTTPEVETIELAAAAHLTGVAFATDKEIFGVVRVGMDIDAVVREHGAVASVRQIGGLVRSWQTVARLAVDLYAVGYDDVWRAQAALTAHLAGGWRPNTAPGEGGIRIDSWRNESDASEQSYPGDLNVVTSIWRVTTRHMPA